MPFVSALVSVGGSLLSGAMGSDAASSAASAQAAATDRATEEQKRQFDLTRSDYAPFVNTGVAANKRLAYLLGLPVSGASVQASPTSAIDRSAIRSELLPQFTRQELVNDGGNAEGGNWVLSNVIDEAALNRAIEDRVASLQAQQAQQVPTEQVTPVQDADYGSLLRKFTTQDLKADPVYQSGLQFGLDEGERAINQRAIAGGNYDSGATLKALAKYATDYAGTKANEAYNRFVNDQGNIFNRLSGVSGSGQAATGQVASAGSNTANNVSQLAQDAGNARAAGIVGGSNAWSNALSGVSGAANNYTSNQMLSQLLKPRSSWNGSSLSNYFYGNGGTGD